ncbi:MAG: hypothetical protein H0S85_02115 [Desulfovibrionaceae bacterium]|nr:hypothetical protein [Desulfovibrionaceae bacterium]
MRKHQFVKTDCECLKRATRFVCKHCGVMEYRSARELKALSAVQAACDHPDAPAVPPREAMRARFGGTIDCLAPDWETYMRDSGACRNC